MKIYQPNNQAEGDFIRSDNHRFNAITGDCATGKTTIAIQKILRKLEQGHSALMVSRDLPHFRKILWPEFIKWINPEWVVERQRYRLEKDWRSGSSFSMIIEVNGNYSHLFCGGIYDPIQWAGLNVHCALYDDLRLDFKYNSEGNIQDKKLDEKEVERLKRLNAICRISGKRGEIPQIIVTSEKLPKGWQYPGVDWTMFENTLEHLKLKPFIQ